MKSKKWYKLIGLLRCHCQEYNRKLSVPHPVRIKHFLWLAGSNGLDVT
jgi:hypothetical protein